MAGVEPDWSRISEDLLFSIIKLLPARIDILRLRAVCRSFRATVPPPPIQYPFPQSILTTTDFLNGPNPDINDVSNLTASTVYAIEPLNRISNTQDEDTPQTWLVKVHESNSGRVRIIAPMTGRACENLSDKLPKSLNLLDYRVTEIGKFYELKSTVSKVIYSPSLDENDDEFTVMESARNSKELGMWRNLDKKWIKIDMELDYFEFFEDIIYHNRKFYAVLSKGYTVTVDPKSFVVTEVAEELQLDWDQGFSTLYLIELNNDLILIVHFEKYYGYDEEDCCIMLFKLNEENQKWVPVVEGLELEDRVLFVGESRCGFSFSIKEVAGCKAGCVYYESCISIISDYPVQRTRICDFKDHVDGHISRFPSYLNLFWPPPAWLKQELTASAGEKQRRGSRDDCEETSQA